MTGENGGFTKVFTHMLLAQGELNQVPVLQGKINLTAPSYETRAECRMLRMFGADLVGMSTVPEIIVARHAGIRVLAMSLVTNNAVLETGPQGNDPLLQNASSAELKQIIEKGRANHEEVLEEGRLAALDMQALVARMVDDMETSQ
jgi:purine-nucleoside phosphorylase